MAITAVTVPQTCSRFVLPILLLCAVVSTGCARQGRVLVLALDGADPEVVDLLMSEGKLPNFARLRQEGAYGRLQSLRPLLSPVVWTTVATGKPPLQHGIGHFVAYSQGTGDRLPVTSRMRKVEALWNIVSASGRDVSVVGWWATWPAEAVNGTIVSDHLCYHFLFQDGFTGGAPDAAARTHPPGLIHEIKDLVRRPDGLSREDAAAFVNLSAEEFRRPFSFQDDLGHFKWALATTMSYEAIARYLWKRDAPDLMMLYIEGIDTVSHLYGHLFRAEGLAGELRDQQLRYGEAVERMYVHADRLIGNLLRDMDRYTTLVVLSDHGFRLGTLPDDPSRTRDMRRVSEAFHEEHGILYIHGHRVRPYSRLDEPGILDIAPTVLSLLGLPPAQDMPGRVLAEGFRGLENRDRVATYETGAAREVAAARDPQVDAEILSRLESLGYLATPSAAGRRNMAAVLFESGRYEEAVRSYEEMIRETPRDGALHASLAGALGALGRYDEALDHLSLAIDLEPLNAEAYHNRAVVQERRGNLEKAIRDYREALRYNPGFEPSRRALARLGAASHPDGPRTPLEEEARQVAERASLAARRGDYAEAMRLLDEAEVIAPSYALVHQYRSNVAYLMGDRAAAIEALKKGLAIEPGNALFLENLRRLESSTRRDR